MVRIRFTDTGNEIRIKELEITGGAARERRRVRDLLPPEGYPTDIPDPDLHLAEEAVREFGAVILEWVPVELKEGAIY